MRIKYPIADAHTFSQEEVLGAYKTNAEKGLSESEAKQRTKEFGRNVYQTQKQKSIWMIMLLQFKSPIVYLLLIAVAVTLYFQDYIEAISIMAVILINALIGFLMELQARSSMNALKKMDVTFARVIRDGELKEIPSEQITPGDIIVLEAGDVIPGDAHLIEANQLQCDESSLTGESLPTEKNTEKLPEKTHLGDQFNMVFKGTSVMNGNGKAVITGIAQNTQLGTITSLVESLQKKETSLDKRIKVLSKKLIWITLIMTSVFAITGFIQGRSWILILETSIALAVAAFPEGLSIVVTISLAYGMLSMAKRNAIVKKLSAVETLGSTNVILTDKTGTLTENKIKVDTFCFPKETTKVTIEKNVLRFDNGKLEKSADSFQKLRMIGALCNNASVKKNGDDKTKQLGDPIEVALVHLVDSSGLSTKELQAQHERIDEIPFSSDIKMMGTLYKSPEGYLVAAKGSVESLLEVCSKILVDGAIRALTAEDRKKSCQRLKKWRQMVFGF